MKKSAPLAPLFAVLLFVITAGPLSAQAPGLFVHYTMTGAGIDYPPGWRVSAIDAKGIMAVYFAPGQGTYDPFSMKVRGLVEKGGPFALLVIATPPMARELGFDAEDLYAFIEDTVERKCASGGTSGLEETSIGWLPGKLKTGSWTTPEAGTIQAAAAKTGDGSAVLFICVSGGPESEVQRESFNRMRQSIAIGGTPWTGSTVGYHRLQNETLLIDYPEDWHPAWVEMPDVKLVFFSSVEIELAALRASDFPPPLGAGQTIVMIFLAGGDTASELDGELKNGMEGMLSSLGSDPKILERGSTRLAGIPGIRVSATVKRQNDARIYAHLAAAADPKAGAVVFLGLSSAQDFAKAQKQFNPMIESLILR